MSIAALDWAFKQHIKSPGQKLVLVALANFCNESGHCFPSYKTVGEISGQSERTVMRHMSSLEDAGIVSRERRRRKDGSLSTYNIVLHLENHTPKCPVDKLATSQSRSNLPDKMASLNPSVEPLEGKEEARAREPAEFDAFWKAFPRKVGKGDARKAWAKAKTRPDLEAILSAINRYIAAKPPDRSYCNPSTWINQERWEDVHDDPASNRVSRNNPHQALVNGFAAASARFGPQDAGGESPADWAGNPEGSPRLLEHDGTVDAPSDPAAGAPPDSGADGALLDSGHAGEHPGGDSGGLGPRTGRPAVECCGRDGAGMGEDQGAPPDARSLPEDVRSIH